MRSNPDVSHPIERCRSWHKKAFSYQLSAFSKSGLADR
jgi:hypothetical protein